MRRLLQLVIPCVFLSGCFGPGGGVEVPQDQIYFPVGLALDTDAQHLFVVSSDFDLQYNGGAVQSYRLGRENLADLKHPHGLFDELPKRCSVDDDCKDETANKDERSLGFPVCGKFGLCVPDTSTDPSETDPSKTDPSPCFQKDKPDSDRLLFPGRCQPIDQRPLLVSEVKIGAFATDALMRERPADNTDGAPERLFVPVRGDSTLHWLDVVRDPPQQQDASNLDKSPRYGTLDCGQSNAGGACDAKHRAGNDPSQNTRGVTLNAEPFAIDANEAGDTIVVTNQTTGTASLFVNDWKTPDGPQLRFALASDRIPSRPVGIAAVPRPAVDAKNAPDEFMMTFRDSAQVRLVRYAPDGYCPRRTCPDGSAPDRQYLVDNGGVPIDANSVGSDSRGIAIDASARKLAEQRCAGDAACLTEAALVPLDVYVANRAPSSLLIGRTRPPQEYPYFFQSIGLTTGPSRVVVGQVHAASGELETRVFVVCFDSRRIFVYDPLRSRIETEILTGRGPHAVAVDTKRSLLYVGHFTDSYIGVYSLDLASPATYGTLLGTLGTPRPPRSSK
jgi:hypothetical protein